MLQCRVIFQSRSECPLSVRVHSHHQVCEHSLFPRCRLRLRVGIGLTSSCIIDVVVHMLRPRSYSHCPFRSESTFGEFGFAICNASRADRPRKHRLDPKVVKYASFCGQEAILSRYICCPFPISSVHNTMHQIPMESSQASQKRPCAIDSETNDGFDDLFDLLYICTTTQPHSMVAAETTFLSQCQFTSGMGQESRKDVQMLKKTAYMGKDAESFPPPPSQHRRTRKAILSQPM
jgi:hypothetical protein